MLIQRKKKIRNPLCLVQKRQVSVELCISILFDNRLIELSDACKIRMAQSPMFIIRGRSETHATLPMLISSRQFGKSVKILMSTIKSWQQCHVTVNVYKLQIGKGFQISLY